MEINWLGHSCFKIKGNRATVITDPYPPDLGYTLGQQTAQITTISHLHSGHSYIDGVDGKPKVIKGPGEYEINGVMIIGMATFHDNEEGKTRGKNVVYLYEMDSLLICHLGDIGHTLTARQVEEMGNVDILFIPVGGVSTLNAATAAALVRQVEPKIVIPMHYKTAKLNRELEPVDGFLREMGIKEVQPQPKLSLNRSGLPENTQVLLLSF